MLKPMKPQTGMPRNLFLWILVGVLVISGIVALVSALGGGESGEDQVNAVYTNAAATLAAQQGAALLFTPTVTISAGTFTPTATFLPLPSPTLFTSQILPTNTTGAVSGAVGCNNSVLVADVTFPDNTVVTPGQAIKKTWKLQNTGSCPWTPTYKVTFISGNAMGGVTTPIGITVAPGTTGDVTVDMKAPNTPGDVKGDWILTNDNGQNFGTGFFILVKVSGTAATGTTTVTATATATATTAPAPAAPAPVESVSITLTCTPDAAVPPNYQYSGALSWVDKSNNEDGFRIYLPDGSSVTVPANSVFYNVLPGAFVPSGTSLTFGVEAYNAVGNAAKVTVIKPCP